ncbi:Protein of unknown function [Rhizobium sp. RU35A]|uniref:DUF982 domain-containing protein n=1 Tax=Rhizobium straminoryzae TaxID=1387186 RepID=A0A549TG12_9HYPH|nr:MULTISPECIES: DUF982 domain-containing protein [Rhizobium]TRL41545.1 DUF982 domain-containing protein [Rhizobium straminoryzae]SIQ79208.1 Protein of unknown function [Rhizobium sp. RU35A]
MSKAWKKSVVVRLGDPAEDVVIDSTQAAAWAMIEDWPLDEGPALDRALLVLAAVDAGRQTDDAAREAFVAAAEEAAILLKA